MPPSMNDITIKGVCFGISFGIVGELMFEVCLYKHFKLKNKYLLLMQAANICHNLWNILGLIQMTNKLSYTACKATGMTMIFLRGSDLGIINVMQAILVHSIVTNKWYKLLFVLPVLTFTSYLVRMQSVSPVSNLDQLEYCDFGIQGLGNYYPDIISLVIDSTYIIILLLLIHRKSKENQTLTPRNGNFVSSVLRTIGFKTIAFCLVDIGRVASYYIMSQKTFYRTSILTLGEAIVHLLLWKEFRTIVSNRYKSIHSQKFGRRNRTYVNTSGSDSEAVRGNHSRLTHLMRSPIASPSSPSGNEDNENDNSSSQSNLNNYMLETIRKQQI
jgi:hypothetical protein